MLSSKSQSIRKSISVLIIIMAVLGVATISVSGVAIAQVDSENNGADEETSTIVTQLIDFIYDSVSQLTEQPNESAKSDEEASNERDSDNDQTTEEATDEQESGEEETTDDVTDKEDSEEDQTTEEATDEEESGVEETTDEATNEEDSEEATDGESSDDTKNDSEETESNEEPTLQEVSLETNDVSDGTELQLIVTAESETTVDWLSISLEGPNGNIRGGGSGYDFTEVEDGVWETEYTYTVSDEAASGEYYFDRVQVENKADLQSDPWPDELSTTINND